MSYTTSTSTTTPQKKDNRGLIYGLLIAALVVTWGYMFYDKNKSSEKVQQLQTQVTTLDETRENMQSEFNVASARLDSLTGSNIKLQGALAEKNDEVQKLKTEISRVLKNKNATASELAQARRMINELNGKMDEMLAEVEKLKSENQQLTVTNEQLNVEKTQLTTERTALQENLQKTSEEKTRVEDIASTLKASNINITAIDVKGNGKQKETTVAKKVDMMRVSFDLDENRIAPTGQKELYVLVTGPDGSPISNGEAMVTRDSGEKKYTSKVVVDYEQGKRSAVSFDWKPESEIKYQTGNYKIEIYQNGYKIGESTKTLKKGGLFS